MTTEQKEYLDTLRDSGITNMWGSPAFIEQRYGISWQEASDIVSEWMKSFK